MKRQTVYPIVHKNKTRAWLKAWENKIMHQTGAARPLAKRTSNTLRKGGVTVQYSAKRMSTVAALPFFIKKDSVALQACYDETMRFCKAVVKENKVDLTALYAKPLKKFSFEKDGEFLWGTLREESQDSVFLTVHRTKCRPVTENSFLLEAGTADTFKPLTENDVSQFKALVENHPTDLN